MLILGILLMSKILLDTNILIYAFDRSLVYHKKSLAFFENTNDELFISTKNISEFFSVCSKLNFDLNTTLGFYADIKANFTTLYPNEVSLNIFETMIRKYNPRGNRVYDIEIVSIMIANDLKKIATANIGDFIDIDEIEVIEIK